MAVFPKDSICIFLTWFLAWLFLLEADFHRMKKVFCCKKLLVVKKFSGQIFSFISKAKFSQHEMQKECLK